MSNKYIDGIKTIAQGALGAMTFGAYHQFTTNRIMELNNNYMELKHNQDLKFIQDKHNKEIKELHDELDLLKKYIIDVEKKSKHWFW